MAQSLTRLDKEKYWKPFCQTLDQRRMKMRARRLLKSTNVIVVLLMLIGSFMNPAPIVLADASGSVDSGLTPSSTEIAVGETDINREMLHVALSHVSRRLGIDLPLAQSQ